MKKLFFMMLGFVLFLLTACESNEKYIATVKDIRDANGVSVEETVNKYLQASEFMEKYRSDAEFQKKASKITSQIEFMKQYGEIDYDNAQRILRAVNYLGWEKPRDISMNWEVEGETKDGKVLKVSSGNSYAKIPTYKNGDYVELKFDEINLYSKASSSQIGRESLTILMPLIDFMKTYMTDSVKNTASTTTTSHVNSDPNRMTYIEEIDMDDERLVDLDNDGKVESIQLTGAYGYTRFQSALFLESFDGNGRDLLQEGMDSLLYRDDLVDTTDLDPDKTRLYLVDFDRDGIYEILAYLSDRNDWNVNILLFRYDYSKNSYVFSDYVNPEGKDYFTVYENGFNAANSGNWVEVSEDYIYSNGKFYKQ